MQYKIRILAKDKKNTPNRPGKAEFGGIAKINLHG